MAVHVKRIAVREYFVLNVTDDSCLVFPLYKVFWAVILCFILHYWYLHRYQQYVLLSISWYSTASTFYHIGRMLLRIWLPLSNNQVV